MRIPSTKIDQVIYFVAVDSADLKTRKTGLTSFTVYRSRNGAAATLYTTPTVAELSAANMPGVYSLLVDEDTTIAAGSDSEEYAVHITQASMAPVTRVIELYRRDTTSGQTLTVTTGTADANATRLLGTAISAPATAGIMDVNTKNINNVAAATPGASGGVLISGSNSGTTTLGALTVTGNLRVENGITVPAPTTGNRPGMELIGNGTGEGLRVLAGSSVTDGVHFAGSQGGAGFSCYGGATGPGVYLQGGATSGPSLSMYATDGSGIDIAVDGTNAHGITVQGGSAGVCDGIRATAGVGGVPIRGDITGNITGTLSTVTTLTNLPAITANWLTAAGTAADFTTEIQAGLATSAALATVQADTDDIQTRLPAALTSGGNIKTDTLYMNAAVWFDTGGAAGTTNYTHGTMTNPNSSIANSRTIANSLNLKNFYINNNSTVTLDQGYSGFSFFGEKWTLALANRLIDNSFFAGATVSGLSTGTGWQFEHCTIGTVTLNAPGLIRNSGLTGTLTIGAAGVLSIHDCTSEVAAGGEWTLAFGAVGATTVGLRRFAGNVTVTGMATGDVLIISGWGAVILDATCTAGTVYIRGNFELTNNGSGQTVTDSARWNEDQTLPAIWDVDATAHQTQGTFGQAIGDPVADTNTLFKAVVTDATGATVGVDVVALKAETVSIQADTDNIQTRLPAALVSGRMDSDVGAMQANVVTAAAIAADAIGASELSAAAATEIADAVWVTTVRSLTTAAGVKKNTALANFEFFMRDSTDHITGKTGLNTTNERSIDGGAFAACANTETEVSAGVYKINLEATDLNGDIITFKFTGTGADPTLVTIKTEA
jgi:hypothetical protein